MLTRTATNLLSQTLNWTDNDNNKNNFVIKKNYETSNIESDDLCLFQLVMS
jgi:hypothetical protein